MAATEQEAQAEAEDAIYLSAGAGTHCLGSSCGFQLWVPAVGSFPAPRLPGTVEAGGTSLHRTEAKDASGSYTWRGLGEGLWRRGCWALLPLLLFTSPPWSSSQGAPGTQGGGRAKCRSGPKGHRSPRPLEHLFAVTTEAHTSDGSQDQLRCKDKKYIPKFSSKDASGNTKRCAGLWQAEPCGQHVQMLGVPC